MLRRREALGPAAAAAAEAAAAHDVAAYILARMRAVATAPEIASEARALVSGGYLDAMDSHAVVGRCRLTPGFNSQPRACFQALRPKCEEPLSHFAFKCNLRHYITVAYRESGALHAFALAWSPSEYERRGPSAEAGRCKLTPGFCRRPHTCF